jgi:hypothetical protein
MKTSIAWIIIGLSAFAVAQQRLVFKDSRKNPRIRIEGNRGLVIPDSKFELSGQVIVQNFEDKLKMSCEKVTGDLIKEGTKSGFDNVRLTGGVKVVMGEGVEIVNMSATSANYDLQGTDKSKITMSGSVDFAFVSTKDSAKSRDLKVTASSLETMLLREKGVKNPVLSAKLTGGVTFVGVEVKKGKDEKSGKDVVTSQKLQIKANEATYLKRGESGNGEVILKGDLVFLQNPGDDDGAEVTGAQSAILELDDLNRVKLIRFSAGGQGANRTPITTIIKKKKGASV